MGMIRFDDMLRTTIEEHKTLQPEVIIGLITSTMLNYGYDAQDINMIAGETKKSLRGMKHELGVESVLYQLPEGFVPEDTTDKDDKEGADFIVRCPNGVLVYIDVKASQETADEAIERRDEYFAEKHMEPPKNKIILYSGFEDKDFDPQSPWVPTQEAVRRVMPYIEENLRQAAEAELQSRTAEKGLRL
jgi:hypothetical protein